MSAIKDGGPAFPQNPEARCSTQYVRDHDEGMTLRDWFAGQALVGLLAGQLKTDEVKVIVDDAFIVADEMLKARENKE